MRRSHTFHHQATPNNKFSAGQCLLFRGISEESLYWGRLHRRIQNLDDGDKTIR